MNEKQTRCVHCNSPKGLHHPKTKQCPDPLGWRSLTFTPRLMARNAMTGEMRELDQSGIDTSAQDAQDRETELMMHDILMHSLLDDLGAPRHPGNDPKRPAYGQYGRLKAYAESIGIKASTWEPPTP